MRLTDKELLQHVKDCEAEYKAALATRMNWEEQQRDDVELPNWTANMEETAHNNWAVAVELAFLRGLPT